MTNLTRLIVFFDETGRLTDILAPNKMEVAFMGNVDPETVPLPQLRDDEGSGGKLFQELWDEIKQRRNAR